jgi:hypothetical protein
MNDTSQETDLDLMRTKYGFWIIIVGFIIVLGAFAIAIVKWSDAKDVTAGVGAVTGIVGSLSGAFFGFHAGAAGKEKAEAERNKVHQQLARLAALMPPAEAARALNIKE